MHTRENALQNWLKSINIQANEALIPLAGDASFRRYFRLKQDNQSQIVMDAPPEKISLHPFIQVAAQLSQQGFRTPQIHAIEHQLGFMLLEDFGDQIFLKTISTHNADRLYRQALLTLAKMQQCTTEGLHKFDQAFMQQELSQFPEWFLQRYLGLALTSTDHTMIQQTFKMLTHTVAQQPQVFVHRDYHSRNIMILKESDTPELHLGLIDFQDAVRGPWTYDLVSLLKDCYIEWPREQVVQWVRYFHGLLPNSATYSFNDFLRDFDWCGLQRHLRVLGTFCRLCLRDNKPNYLKDLPLTFRYVMSCLSEYETLQPFYTWMQQRVEPVFLRLQS